MSLSDRDGYIWVDGELCPWREARLHFLTHTLHYGLGVFEGVRAYQAKQGTCVFRLREHTERLLRSAHILGMKIPYTLEELNQAQIEVLLANDLHEAYIRPMCFYDSEEMGLRTDTLSVRTMIAAWEWPSYMDPEAREVGIRVQTSSYVRHHVNSTMCKAKACGHYVNSILALQEARHNGCEEALLLDQEGYVSEGSGENIFIVRDKKLCTPPLDSCLEGITRDAIIHLARDAQIEVEVRHITRDEVYIADEAFFTGTAAEVVPIQELDRRVIGNGKRGDITAKLQALYGNEIRGEKTRHPEWLTPVERQ